ncbi:SIR2 family NAD-dependent protein deacylase [Pseudomonas sp. CFBP 13719]|uniref:SIR2 family NAD-dependent protein deacylase n=1 Tax=Pseudomonas sp. CFBP 13719 TaxID=2775303 RepID=UPI003138AE79
MNILAITGAGLSVGSGLPTYRGAQGRYTAIEAEYGMPVEKIVSVDTLNNRPELLWKHWLNMHAQYAQATPSIGHFALKRLSEAANEYMEVTQNVDGLSLKTGIDPRNVIELHGSAQRYVCQKCGFHHQLGLTSDMIIPPRCYRCRDPENAFIRPDVVMFGENVDENDMNRAIDYAMKVDLVIVTGTTLAFLYLIAILAAAVEAGAKVIYIDPEADREHPMFYTAPDHEKLINATTAIRSTADEALCKLVPALIEGDVAALAEFGL